ncbi:hypothetical protein EB810_14360 [Altererythrobacter sp. FM1]|nr:hypothetical protein EB810_14360 [Altererythrobacter sp. FM1]
MLLVGTLTLGACQQQATSPEQHATADSTAPVAIASEAATPAPVAATLPSADAAPQPSPPSDITDAYRGEKGARGVLLTWAHALENGNYALAWEQFGNDGKDSGTSKALYSAQFDKYRRITVAMPSGTIEGAAGSSYYTAPTTLTGELRGGGVEVLKGDVVLRRVNDVPGASSEQLHWYIYKADLKPVN